MNLNNFISPFVIGVATLTIVQPQMVFAQTRQDINIIAKSITVRIDGREYGTGVIVNRQGNTYTVLTNWHVVGNEGKQRVTTFDNQSYEINPISIKQVGNFDLAIFEFTANKNYDVAEIVNEQLVEGTNIYITGYPSPRPPISIRIYQFTEGYISGTNSQDTNGFALIYTNATRPGMSGSPILNNQGKLIGIHGLTEGIEIKNQSTGFTEIKPRTEDGYKLGIHIDNFLNWANLNYQKFNISSTNNSNLIENRKEVVTSLEVDESILKATYSLVQQDFVTAISYLNQALDLEPNNVDAYLIRSDAYYWSGNQIKALADIDSVIKIDPNNANAYVKKSQIYSSQLNPEQALNTINKAIDIDPNLPDAYLSRSRVYLFFRNYDASIKDINKYIELKPNDPIGYYEKGGLYMGLMKYNKAKDTLTLAETKALEQGNTSIATLARTLLDHLKNIINMKR